MDKAYIDSFLSDPERLMAFAIQERELAQFAEFQFRDPIAAKYLRKTADQAQLLAGQAGGYWEGDWTPNDPYIL